MAKLTGESMNITEENIKKLQQLFPECACDGKVDFDKLKQVLGEFVDDDTERYNFTWNGKGRALRLSQTPSMGTLRPCKEESVDWDNTKNLYIEGDNLEVLKILQKSYYGKVKMIYIDPPYNTGNDFVYPDNYSDNIYNYKRMTGQIDKEGKDLSSSTEANGRFHTDWLNMMYSRLRIARNFLSEDGMIFISIDDNEFANLEKICDEIFGENNFLGTFVVNSTPNARDYGHVGKMHEFVLFYAKNCQKTTSNLLEEEGKQFRYEDKKGGFNIHPLYNSNETFNKENRPNLYYPFYLYKDKKLDKEFYEIGLEKRENAVEIYPPLSMKNQVQFVWRWGKDKALEFMNKEIVGYETNNGEYRIVQKMRHNAKLIRSLLLDTKYSSRRGTAEVEELLNGKIFSFPKPLELLRDFVLVGSDDDSIIMDFFSGSGTLAQAVMSVNDKTNGSRKYILVQIPEKCGEETNALKNGYINICEIAKKRIKESIKLIENENVDTGFKVFKLDYSNLKKWQPKEDLEASILDYVDNFLEDGRTEMDVLYEIMLKMGLDLNCPIDTIHSENVDFYSVGSGSLMVCLADEITENVAKQMVKTHNELQSAVWKVVFKDNGFSSDSSKTNIKEIFKCAGLKEEAFTTI